MNIIGAIPARYASTRFNAKVLAEILGKPMIQHVWERAKQARLLSEVIIACDDERIFKAARNFGAKAVLTSKSHASGSDRIAEAVESLNADIVVNVQGDEPLVDPLIIDNLAQVLVDDPSVVMATVIKPINGEKELENPNVVKAVTDKDKFVLHFSRSPIPFERDENISPKRQYKHLGLYSYRKDFLLKFTQLPKSPLEISERLEQLRVLEAGYKIKAIETDIETIGVDTQEDLDHVKKYLKQNS